MHLLGIISMEYNLKVIQEKYQLVPRTVVFIEKGEEILLLHKQKKDSFGYKKLNGIGGHIEQGEDSTEATRREIFEETGLKIKDLELAAMIFIDIRTNPGILLFVYKAKYTGGKLIDSDEGKLIWAKKSDIGHQENIVKDIPFLINIIDSHEIGAKPAIGKYIYDEKGELRIVI